MAIAISLIAELERNGILKFNVIVQIVDESKYSYPCSVYKQKFVWECDVMHVETDLRSYDLDLTPFKNTSLKVAKSYFFHAVKMQIFACSWSKQSFPPKFLVLKI